MGDKNNYKQERFDSFLNKTIILSSRTYFKKQSNISNKEKTIVDNEDYSAYLLDFIASDAHLSDIDKIDLSLQLKNALNSLTAIEQSVIFLLFQEELSQDEAAKILEIWSKSVSRIKVRAIEKLRKYLKGDLNNER